jgi:pimeloyl-ACP methyl ester carboxylesterase
METTEVHGLRIAYERAGDGPPLVLLHGYVGDGPTTWRPQLEGLGDELTMIAWDAPGAGRSSDPPESFGMTGYADCLAGFVERLGLEHPARGRAVVRWRARPGPLPPPGRPAGDPDPGVRGRRLGRLSARRGHRPASPAGDGLADPPPAEFVGTSSRRCSPRPPRPSRSTPSAPACSGSTRSASAPWPAPPPRTSATPFPTSPSPPCWSTAIRTCAP